MLDALRAPPAPGRDMQASEDLFMDPRRNAHVTRPRAALNRLISPILMSVQRAQNVSVPLPRTFEPPVPDPFSASATWKRCTRDTTFVSQRRSDAFDATISDVFQERQRP